MSAGPVLRAVAMLALSLCHAVRRLYFPRRRQGGWRALTDPQDREKAGLETEADEGVLN